MHPEAVQTRLSLACYAHQSRDLICPEPQFLLSCDGRVAWLVPVMKAELCKGFILWSCMRRDGCHAHLPWAPCSKNCHQGKRPETPFENLVLECLPASINTLCPSSCFDSHVLIPTQRLWVVSHCWGPPRGHHAHTDPMSQYYMNATFHQPGNFKNRDYYASHTVIHDTGYLRIVSPAVM